MYLSGVNMVGSLSQTSPRYAIFHGSTLSIHQLFECLFFARTLVFTVSPSKPCMISVGSNARQAGSWASMVP